METKIGEALSWAARKLSEAGIGPARLEGEVLLAFVLGCTRTQLLAALQEFLPAGGHLRFTQLVERRADRYPLQYLTGHQEFMSLDFLVSPEVLIPRPDTEVLVEQVLTISRRAARPVTVVDVGTGSGAIAVSFAVYLPEGSRVLATDLSEPALAVARTNARRLGAQVEFLQGDLLAPLLAESRSRREGPGVDVIVANPPYIPAAEIDTLDPEIRWEPQLALDGGIDGLAVYRSLIPQAAELLLGGGRLALEIGWDQADPVCSIIRQTGQFYSQEVVPDYGGCPRVIVARKK